MIMVDLAEIDYEPSIPSSLYHFVLRVIPITWMKSTSISQSRIQERLRLR